MRIKTISLMENGDFDVLVSFSPEDITNIGIDTTYNFIRAKDILKVIWDDLKKDIIIDNKRAWSVLK